MARQNKDPDLHRADSTTSVSGYNARLTYSRDAVGTWLFLMDDRLGKPIPLKVYGPDRDDELKQIISLLEQP